MKGLNVLTNARETLYYFSCNSKGRDVLKSTALDQFFSVFFQFNQKFKNVINFRNNYLVFRFGAIRLSSIVKQPISQT